MSKTQKLRRKTPVISSIEEDDNLPFEIPKWNLDHFQHANYQKYRQSNEDNVVSGTTSPAFYVNSRSCLNTRLDSKYIDSIKARCKLTKTTVQEKLQKLSIDNANSKESLSAEVAEEIERILLKQRRELIPSLQSQYDRDISEESKKEDDDLQSFAATWNFSHIAGKVISARRQLKSERPNTLAALDRRQSIKSAIETGLAEQSVSDVSESLSTTTIISRAQELVTKCMESMVTVASSLSEDALSSYPGAELSSSSSVLGFELKTVSGSSHKHRSSSSINHNSSDYQHNSAQSHQRMFFIVRFDLREYRKVSTAARSSSMLEESSSTEEKVGSHSDSNKIKKGNGQSSISADFLPSFANTIQSESLANSFPKVSTPSDVSSPSLPASNASFGNQHQAQTSTSLRDRAKEVLRATDMDLLRKARRRIRLESLKSLTVKRSLVALSAFHTALSVLLSTVDIDPPPFPDTFLFGAVEEAAIAHQSQQSPSSNNNNGSVPTGSGGIQGLWTRWFPGAPNTSHASSGPSTPSSSAKSVSSSSSQSSPSLSTLPPLAVSAASFKDVCDQLQTYLNDVLALYEYLDEMLAALPAPVAAQMMPMVANAQTDISRSSNTAISNKRVRAISTGAASVVEESRELPALMIAQKGNHHGLGSRESKSTSDLPAEAEAMMLTTTTMTPNASLSELQDKTQLQPHIQEQTQPPSGSISPSSQQQQQPDAHLWYAAAALAQLLRELLVASDVGEAQIGSFILRSVVTSDFGQKPSSPTVFFNSDSVTAPSSSSATNSNLVALSSKMQQSLISVQQTSTGRTFWAFSLPRAALTVRFAGGSFGTAGTKPSSDSQSQTIWEPTVEDTVNSSNEQVFEDNFSMGVTDSHRGHQNLLKAYDEADLLRVQLSRCLGCGEILSSSLFGLGKNYAMCHFFGALFCQRWCHGSDSRPIPMRVLHQWDCRPRKVCKVAAAFIDRVRELPLIRVREANPLLLEGVPKLKRTLIVQQMLRTGLLPRSLWADSEAVLLLLSDFLPQRNHLVLADGLFSLDDLLAIESDRMRHLLQCVVEELMHLKSLPHGAEAFTAISSR